MQRARWPGISHDVMVAVRRAVTDVLMLHEVAATVEVTVRVQPRTLRHVRAVDVAVDAQPANDEREDDQVDQLQAAQAARFRALEL